MLPHCIVAIGASTFFGRVDPEGGGFIGRLKTWHESNHRKNRVYNLGISSETSNDLIRRFESECTPRKPDLIIMGTSCANDCRRRGSKSAPNEVELEQHEQNIRDLITTGQKFCPIMVVSGHPIDDTRTNPMIGTDKFFSSEDLTRYRECSRSIFERENIPYLDVSSEWIKTDYHRWLWEDGLHPNGLGHQMIFSSLKQFLINHFNPK